MKRKGKRNKGKKGKKEKGKKEKRKKGKNGKRKNGKTGKREKEKERKRDRGLKGMLQFHAHKEPLLAGDVVVGKDAGRAADGRKAAASGTRAGRAGQVGGHPMGQSD